MAEILKQTEQEGHWLQKLMDFLDNAKRSGTLRFIKCNLSQSGDGGEAYNIKIPTESEMEKIQAMISEQAAGRPTAAPPAAQPAAAPAAAPAARPAEPAVASSRRNIVRASKDTARHLRGYYPTEFLKRMGLA